jgi:mannonate dehydratase
MIRLAEFAEPGDEALCRLLVQVGVEEVVSALPWPAGGSGTSRSNAAVTRSEPPWSLVPLRLMQQGYLDLGLRLTVIEDSPPMDAIRLGRPGREEELEAVSELVRAMGALGIPVWCLNFMGGVGWARTSMTVPGRGGALVTAYDHDVLRGAPPVAGIGEVGREAMQANLRWFLERIVPVAEEAGVRLALHPDDPPLPAVRGIARLLASLDDLEAAIDTVPSAALGLTFCQGNITLMTDDLPAAIRRFAARGAIHFVHFRDVAGTPERFVETFHDEGPTDMAACMRAYLEAGVDAPLRCDHVATLHGDSNARAGYSTLGRLHAVGYIAGLRDACAT